MNRPEYYCYPVIFSYEDGQEISAFFPDLDVATSGIDEADALASAQDLLGLVLYGLEVDDENIPLPSKLKDIQCAENEHSTLVRVFMPTIREQNNNRAINKTVTIPAWMDAKARELKVNFSQVLQKGINEIIAESSE